MILDPLEAAAAGNASDSRKTAAGHGALQCVAMMRLLSLSGLRRIDQSDFWLAGFLIPTSGALPETGTKLCRFVALVPILVNPHQACKWLVTRQALLTSGQLVRTVAAQLELRPSAVTLCYSRTWRGSVCGFSTVRC